MRWLRGGLIVLVGAGLLALAIGVTAGSFSAVSCEDATVSHETIVGKVVSKDGSAVTFTGEDGSTLVISYPGDGARFLHPGTTYRVGYWGNPGDPRVVDLVALPRGGHVSFRRLGDQHRILGTRAARRPPAVDGGRAGRDRSAHRRDRGPRRRHPRLTIEGKPLSNVR